MIEQKFFRCKYCGNFSAMLYGTDSRMMCCDAPMVELVPGLVEASTEKHIPVVTVDGDTVTVQVGSVRHPMLEDHHIQFIYLQTEKGGQKRYLTLADGPAATFKLADDDRAVAAYEYCNLHSLWKCEIK